MSKYPYAQVLGVYKCFTLPKKEAKIISYRMMPYYIIYKCKSVKVSVIFKVYENNLSHITDVPHNLPM